MSWRPDWGPASLLAIAQLIVLFVGGIYTFATLQNTATNTKITADALQAIVERQQVRTTDIGERLIKVETELSGVTNTLTRMDNKLDALRR